MRADASANLTVMAWPIPEVAPVTSTTLSAKLSFIQTPFLPGDHKKTPSRVDPKASSKLADTIGMSQEYFTSVCETRFTNHPEPHEKELLLGYFQDVYDSRKPRLNSKLTCS